MLPVEVYCQNAQLLLAHGAGIVGDETPQWAIHRPQFRFVAVLGRLLLQNDGLQ